jgi:hypothetical protein
MLQFVDSTTLMTLLRPAPDGGVRVVVFSARQFITTVTPPNQPVLMSRFAIPSSMSTEAWRRSGPSTRFGSRGRSLLAGDAFHLVRKQGRWRLLNVRDTFRRTVCGDPWPR